MELPANPAVLGAMACILAAHASDTKLPRRQFGGTIFRDLKKARNHAWARVGKTGKSHYVLDLEDGTYRVSTEKLDGDKVVARFTSTGQEVKA